MRRDIAIITNKEPGWPNSLVDLGKMEPKQLWYEGDVSLLKGKSACVVGSRRITDYGRRVVEKLVPRLVQDGKTIISGFMYGTDQAAHKETIACGGKTVAVLGWGISQKLEGSDQKLAEEILSRGGLILSEWENQPGALWTFPQRDRIMAALTSDIYIVEAATKSGSLITADWGIKLKRQIWAVPGPVTSRVSEGTNWLIGQGLAKIWVSNSVASSQKLANECDIKNMDLYIAIQNDTLTADELARKLGRPVSEVGARLSMLELEGKVVERGGKYYINE